MTSHNLNVEGDKTINLAMLSKCLKKCLFLPKKLAHMCLSYNMSQSLHVEPKTNNILFNIILLDF